MPIPRTAADYFAALLTQEFYVSPFEGRDEWGNPTWGTPVLFTGRLVNYDEAEGFRSRLSDVFAPSIVPVGELITMYHAIGTRDRVTLPSLPTFPYDVTDTKIFMDDSGGFHHQKLTLTYEFKASSAP